MVVQLGGSIGAREVDLPCEGARPDGDDGGGDDTETGEATGAALEAVTVEDEETDDQGTEDGTSTLEGRVKGT